MKSLKGHSAEEVKSAICEHYRSIYTKDDIRLFGSRIVGGYREDSDLDVAIKTDDDEKLDTVELEYIQLLGMNIEIRYVYDFDLSWLVDSK